MAAFSLMELVVVLLILGILAAAAAPQFAQSLSRYRAESAAKRIAEDLRLARRQAKSTSASQNVEFNSPSAHQYELPSLDDPHRPGRTYCVSLSAEPYLAAITAVDFGGDATIVFDGYGRPDSGGSVTVASGSHLRTVVVAAETGVVEVQ